MKFTVESIEDSIARLENGENESVFADLSLLPDSVREGDILNFDGEKYVLDAKASAERRKAVYEKFNRLFRKE